MAGSKLEKLSKRKLKIARDLIASGNYQSVAAAYLGIDEATWYRWLEKGKRAKSGIYREFYLEIKKAEAEAEIRNVAANQKAAMNDWRASSWWLERRHPDRWGRSEKVDVDFENQVVIRIKEV